MSESAKVVRIDEFKARKESAESAGRVLTCAPAAEPRTLTPQEISHRFVMLAFLRKAR